MKLGYLCYCNYLENPVLLEEEPDDWSYQKIVIVVYDEVKIIKDLPSGYSVYDDN